MSRAQRGATSHAKGLVAEDTVLRWYQARGGALIARRWTGGGGEIDLIIRIPDCLIFVEVKARKSPIEDDPVSPAQWRRLEMAAETYILTAQTGATPVRFDVAIVDGSGGVSVIENAQNRG